MLTHIHIKDLAIITSLELELKPGTTALTGETGAGKSILVDALGLALGERADNAMIRSQSERAEITAAFDLSDAAEAKAWLQEQAMEAGDECLIRRILVRDGRSRAFINDQPVTLQALQSLGERLVDIHGQHAHQSLLHRGSQRDLLDAYAGHLPLVETTTRLYQQRCNAQEKLDQLRRVSTDRSAQLDLLRYQVNELEELQLDDQELGELGEEHARLSNMERLQEGCARSLAALYDSESSVQEQLSRISGELRALASVDNALEECSELLDGALIQVQEATTGLRHYAEGLELDPARLAQVEQRLEQLHDMARKHHVRPQQLPERLGQLRNELEALEHADIHLSQLQTEVEQLQAEYLRQAQVLSEGRQRAARELAQRISESLPSLSMPGGQFAVDIQTLPEERMNASGQDQITFLVSANPGQPLQPLSKVASGGELSRISLAIQVVTARCGRIPTLIFDEVDVGIGGGTAEIVGRLLRRLGNDRQVLCVTHLPQVAAQGHHHLQVCKYTDDSSTRTSVQDLKPDQRVQEIARMLGGVEITDQTLAHAEEMMARSLAG